MGPGRAFSIRWPVHVDPVAACRVLPIQTRLGLLLAALPRPQSHCRAAVDHGHHRLLLQVQSSAAAVTP